MLRRCKASIHPSLVRAAHVSIFISPSTPGDSYYSLQSARFASQPPPPPTQPQSAVRGTEDSLILPISCGFTTSCDFFLAYSLMPCAVNMHGDVWSVYLHVRYKRYQLPARWFLYDVEAEHCSTGRTPYDGHCRHRQIKHFIASFPSLVCDTTTTEICCNVSTVVVEELALGASEIVFGSNELETQQVVKYKHALMRTVLTSTNKEQRNKKKEGWGTLVGGFVGGRWSYFFWP